MRAICWAGLLLVVASLGGPPWAVGQARQQRRLKRARPSHWDTKVMLDVFFVDAFKEGLVGARPDRFDRGRPNAGNGKTAVPPGGTLVHDGPSAGRGVWSRIISPQTIEGEVKTIKMRLDRNVTTPGQFARTGYESAHRHFSMLAMLFAVIDGYDGHVRWKSDAVVARDLFAETAFRCTEGTVDAYNAAKKCRLDLQDLVGGGSLSADVPRLKSGWKDVCGLPPLMRRLEQAQEQDLRGWTANEATFHEQYQQILHEAEIVAAIAEMIQQQGFDFFDDPDYGRHAHRLKQAALDVVRAVKKNKFTEARRAVGRMGQTCAACHDGYRG